VSRANFSYVNAKIRGMRAKLWEGARLVSLVDASDLADLSRRLYAGSVFGSWLALERRMTDDHVSVLARVASCLDGRQRDFAWVLIQRCQLENLRTVLRLWSAGEDIRTAKGLVATVPERLSLPIEALMSARDIGEFTALVPVRAMKDGIALGMADYVRTRKTFFLEAGMDRAYFRLLSEVHEALSYEDRRATEELVDDEISAYNAMSTLRAKFNYGLDWDVIRKFLSPRGRTVSPSAAGALYEADAVASAAAVLPRALIGRRPVSADDVGGVERTIWERIFRRANHIYYMSMADLGGVAGFFYIKRVELANLISVTEALRYDFAPARARANLVLLKEVRASA